MARQHSLGIFFFLTISFFGIFSLANEQSHTTGFAAADYLVWRELPRSMTQYQANPQNLRGYKSAIVQELGQISPHFLIRRQRQVYVDHVIKNDKSQRWKLELFDKVLSRQVGLIREMTQLESMLFQKHLEINSTPWLRTEFFAFVLSRGQSLRVYAGFARNNDGVTPPYDPIEKAMSADLKSGWALYAHIHNHPFSKTTALDWGGALIPSAGDVYAFHLIKNKFKAQNFIITNGIHSFTMPVSHLERYPKY